MLAPAQRRRAETVQSATAFGTQALDTACTHIAQRWPMNEPGKLLRACAVAGPTDNSSQSYTERQQEYPEHEQRCRSETRECKARVGRRGEVRCWSDSRCHHGGSNRDWLLQPNGLPLTIKAEGHDVVLTRLGQQWNSELCAELARRIRLNGS